jgi:hypothetical protein
MLKRIIFTALCLIPVTITIPTFAETAKQPTKQTDDWLYLSGNNQGKLYLSKNVARNPKQPSRVFYSFLIILNTPVASREDDIKATTVRGEAVGDCDLPSVNLRSFVLFDQNGTQVTSINPKTMPAERKAFIENTKPGTLGGAFLKTACKLSAK